MSELLALAERCKRSVGPDRELDADIFRAAYGAQVWHYHDNCHIDAQIYNGNWTKPREEHPDFDAALDAIITWRYCRDSKFGELPALTASIDAAMTLVPEGWRFELTTTGFKPGASLVSPRGTPVNGGGAYAATPALALCAAAIRARAAEVRG